MPAAIVQLRRGGAGSVFYGQVRAHPLIQSLSASGQSPSYLPISLIADALIDELINATVATPQADRLLEKLELGIAAIVFPNATFNI
jgi:hypothetical protein